MGPTLAWCGAKRRESSEIVGAHKWMLANDELAPKSFLCKARARPILVSLGVLEIGAT